MSEDQYRAVGWGIFVISIAVALGWCLTESALTAKFLVWSEKLLNVRLKQTSCLFTFLILVLPGYILKRYCEGLAWNAHLRTLPPPDVHDSAKKSKYVTPAVDAPPPVPKPVELSSLPENQAEFIATCAACGHLFSAKRDSKSLQCPNCGENIPLQT